jgi:transposase-like protein
LEQPQAGIITDEEKKMGKQDKARRVYTKEFKAEVVALAGKHGKPVRQIALDLGINENQPVDTAGTGG